MPRIWGYHAAARVAKLAKAAPLKGAAPLGACGFESRPGHGTHRRLLRFASAGGGNAPYRRRSQRNQIAMLAYRFFGGTPREIPAAWLLLPPIETERSHATERFAGPIGSGSYGARGADSREGLEVAGGDASVHALRRP